MVSPSAGSVVLIEFPFSNLSDTKLRPAVCLAAAGRDDWILCQITSNPYGDRNAVQLEISDFEKGTLRQTSYARPGRLFTANTSIMRAEAGHLTPAALNKVRSVIVGLLQQ